jgi:type IV pilus assembly protein PilP
MKQLFIVILSLVLLSGCNDDLDDIQAHMDNVKANARPRVEPLPQTKEFQHIPYEILDVRSPFDEPIAQAIQERFLQQKNCLHPDPNRRKELLEGISLDALKMRGTIGSGNQLWGLIESSDMIIHRITKNNYMGLFNGKVTQVTPNYIELLELVPDGSGCWVERTTRLQLFNASSSGK